MYEFNCHRIAADDSTATRAVTLGRVARLEGGVVIRSLEILILTVVYLAAPVAAPAEVRDASRAGFTSENVATVPVDATAASPSP